MLFLKFQGIIPFLVFFYNRAVSTNIACLSGRKMVESWRKGGFSMKKFLTVLLILLLVIIVAVCSLLGFLTVTEY